MPTRFIALDWGTTSFRAYRVGADATVLESLSAPHGILSVAVGAFDAALESHIGAWDVSLPILASGMITSRQGWIELAYLTTPANLTSIAAALHVHTSSRGRRIYFVPGVSTRGSDGMPDVMRGEETQVMGASKGGAEYFVTPGTHCKWINVDNGAITGFSTYMTGEVFSALKNHSILGRLMTGDTHCEAAFEKGVRAALKDAGGFLHRIFSTRTLALFNELPNDALASYLSGQVIGTEIAHATADHPMRVRYNILASPALAQHYVSAMTLAGLQVQFSPPDVAVKGLHKIAAAAGVVP
jgi:2-dehydro-3-deoxygalactonokinase